MPGSWEITKQRENRVLCATLMPPDNMVTDAREEFGTKMVLPPGSDRCKIKGLPWDVGRNNAAKACIDGGYGWCFMWDSDVLPLDPQIVMKLIETNLPVVSGLYYQRFWPFMPAFFEIGQNEKGEAIRVPIGGWTPGQIVPATFVPTGALLIKRMVLEEVFKHYPEPFKWGVGAAPILEMKDGQVVQAPGFSEDFAFSFKCKQLGFQPFVATGLACLHEFRGVVGPKWIPGLNLPHPDPLYGVCGVII